MATETTSASDQFAPCSVLHKCSSTINQSIKVYSASKRGHSSNYAVKELVVA